LRYSASNLTPVVPLALSTVMTCILEVQIPFAPGLRQLRPVTYRGVCDLTHLELTTYGQI